MGIEAGTAETDAPQVINQDQADAENRV